MTRQRLRRIACALLAAVIATAAVTPAVLAENAPTGAGPPSHVETPQTTAGKSDTADPALDALARRIRYLHERLRITPAQEPGWAALAQVMRDNARTLAPLLRERFRASQGGNATEYLGAFERLGEAQLDGLKKFAAAFDPLYASMSEQQKKIADVLLRLSPLAVLGSVFQLPDDFTGPPRDTYYPEGLGEAALPVAPFYANTPHYGVPEVSGYPALLAPPFPVYRRYGPYRLAAPFHAGPPPFRPRPAPGFIPHP